MPRLRGEFGPEPKPIEDLRTQIENADEMLVDQNIAPDSEGDNILTMSESELKEKYPRRYEMYLKLLREQKSDSPRLTDSELEDMSKWLYILNSLDSYIENHKSSEENRTLREKQMAAFEDLRDFFEQGGTEGYN